MPLRQFLTAASFALGAVPTVALAQDANWFVGFGIGQMKTDGACPVNAAPGTDCEEKNTSWKIVGGYQFNTYLGVELGLDDFGNLPASVSGIGSASVSFRIFELTLVGTLPLSQRTSVYAKAGIFQWNADYDFEVGNSAFGDASGKDYTYGLGVKYQLTRNTALRLEWQRYNNVGDPATTGKFNADVLGAGAVLSF